MAPSEGGVLHLTTEFALLVANAALYFALGFLLAQRRARRSDVLGHY